jgi:hypothetical protein
MGGFAVPDVMVPEREQPGRALNSRAEPKSAGQSPNQPGRARLYALNA